MTDVRFYGGPNDLSFGTPGHVTDPPPPTWYVPQLAQGPRTVILDGLGGELPRPPDPIVYHRRRSRDGEHVVYVTGGLENVDGLILRTGVRRVDVEEFE